MGQSGFLAGRHKSRWGWSLWSRLNNKRLGRVTCQHQGRRSTVSLRSSSASPPPTGSLQPRGDQQGPRPTCLRHATVRFGRSPRPQIGARVQDPGVAFGRGTESRSLSPTEDLARSGSTTCLQAGERTSSRVKTATWFRAHESSTAKPACEPCRASSGPRFASSASTTSCCFTWIR
jgi:hypothetical protein